MYVFIVLGEGVEDGRGRGGERGWDGIGLDGRKEERRDKWRREGEKDFFKRNY